MPVRRTLDLYEVYRFWAMSSSILASPRRVPCEMIEKVGFISCCTSNSSGFTSRMVDDELRYKGDVEMIIPYLSYIIMVQKNGSASLEYSSYT